MQKTKDKSKLDFFMSLTDGRRQTLQRSKLLSSKNLHHCFLVVAVVDFFFVDDSIDSIHHSIL